MRVLIDDNLTLESGNKAETFIEYPDAQPVQANIQDPFVLAAELSYAPITGIQGYRLLEEEILPDGSRQISQEFILAPDVAYAIFKHWQELDEQLNSGNELDE